MSSRTEDTDTEENTCSTCYEKIFKSEDEEFWVDLLEDLANGRESLCKSVSFEIAARQLCSPYLFRVLTKYFQCTKKEDDNGNGTFISAYDTDNSIPKAKTRSKRKRTEGARTSRSTKKASTRGGTKQSSNGTNT
jgi:hypothetical protein